MNEHQQVTNPDIAPSATMLRMISGFRVARAIYIAAKLGLADLLKDGPKGSGELAFATGTHAPSLYRVMRALASVGIFAEDEQGLFTLDSHRGYAPERCPWLAARLGDFGLRGGRLPGMGRLDVHRPGRARRASSMSSVWASSNMKPSIPITPRSLMRRWRIS